MFNNVILLGNLIRDIKLRYLQSGSAIGKSGIAVTKKYYLIFNLNNFKIYNY